MPHFTLYCHDATLYQVYQITHLAPEHEYRCDDIMMVARPLYSTMNCHPAGGEVSIGSQVYSMVIQTSRFDFDFPGVWK